MITNISLHNYSNFLSLSVALQPFTVFVGPNASGKTKLLHSILSAEAELTCTEGQKDIDVYHSLACDNIQSGRVRIGSKTVKGKFPGDPFSAVSMNTTHKITERMFALLSKDPETWDRVVRALDPLIHELGTVCPDGMGVELKGSNRRVDFDLLNPGIGRFFCALVVGYSEKNPAVLLLDEIDRGFHPGAQTQMVQAYRDLQKKQPHIQILATTHAAQVIHVCKKEEIAELYFGDTGKVCVRTHDTLPAWMTPTEIMSTYFGVKRLSISELTQRYAFIAGNPHRTDEEEQELKVLGGQLSEYGVALDWKPTKRRST